MFTHLSPRLSFPIFQIVKLHFQSGGRLTTIVQDGARIAWLRVILLSTLNCHCRAMCELQMIYFIRWYHSSFLFVFELAFVSILPPKSSYPMVKNSQEPFCLSNLQDLLSSTYHFLGWKQLSKLTSHCIGPETLYNLCAYMATDVGLSFTVSTVTKKEMCTFL